MTTSSVEVVRVRRGLCLAAPWPAVLLEDERALVVADLHLGLEDEQEQKGVHIPVSVFPKIADAVLQPARALGTDRVILLGDVKHEFGQPTEAEWFAVRKLFRRLREAGQRVEVVRGNHDNYIVTILRELKVALHQPSLDLGRWLLKHGHEPLTGVERRAKHVIMGHEHPAISLRDDVGAKHRFKALLHGSVDSRILTVLPSVSPLAVGSEVNQVPSTQFLSPLLRGKSVGRLVPYVIEPGEAFKPFPALRYL